MGKSGSTNSREAAAKVSQENDDGGAPVTSGIDQIKGAYSRLLFMERMEGERERKEDPERLGLSVCPGAIESDEEILRVFCFWNM